MQYSKLYLNKQTNKQREDYYQGLRGVAILAVVFIHTLGITENNNLIIVIRQLINYAVPLFLFLSGFFCRKQYESGKFDYKKSLIKILVPYFMWSFLLLLRVKFYNFNLSEILISLITARHFGIYYYIILLSQLIMLSPILLSKKFNAYILIITPISVLIYSYLRLKGHNIIFPFNVLFFWNVISFYYLGMYFDEVLKKLKNINWYITFLIISIFNSLETLYFYKSKETFDLAISQFKLSSLVMTFGLILFIIQNKRLKNFFKNKLLVKLGDLSFGIYLIHALLIGILSKVVSKVIENKIILFLIVTLLVLIGSILIILIIRKISNSKSKYLGC